MKLSHSMSRAHRIVTGPCAGYAMPGDWIRSGATSFCVNCNRGMIHFRQCIKGPHASFALAIGTLLDHPAGQMNGVIQKQIKGSRYLVRDVDDLNVECPQSKDRRPHVLQAQHIKEVG